MCGKDKFVQVTGCPAPLTFGVHVPTSGLRRKVQGMLQRNPRASQRTNTQTKSQPVKKEMNTAQMCSTPVSLPSLFCVVQGFRNHFEVDSEPWPRSLPGGPTCFRSMLQGTSRWSLWSIHIWPRRPIPREPRPEVHKTSDLLFFSPVSICFEKKLPNSSVHNPETATCYHQGGANKPQSEITSLICPYVLTHQRTKPPRVVCPAANWKI